MLRRKAWFYFLATVLAIGIPFKIAQGKELSRNYMRVNEKPPDTPTPVTITNNVGFPVYYDMISQPNGQLVGSDFILQNAHSLTHLPKKSATIYFDGNICQPGIQTMSINVQLGRYYTFLMNGDCHLSLDS